MKPAAFAYAKARSLDDAIRLLGEHSDAKLLAGGQSLIATLNMRLSHPSMLIDINGVAGLDGATALVGLAVTYAAGGVALDEVLLGCGAGDVEICAALGVGLEEELRFLRIASVLSRIECLTTTF